jgi:hypothetical protein
VIDVAVRFIFSSRKHFDPYASWGLQASPISFHLHPALSELDSNIAEINFFQIFLIQAIAWIR